MERMLLPHCSTAAASRQGLPLLFHSKRMQREIGFCRHSPVQAVLSESRDRPHSLLLAPRCAPLLLKQFLGKVRGSKRSKVADIICHNRHLCAQQRLRCHHHKYKICGRAFQVVAGDLLYNSSHTTRHTQVFLVLRAILLPPCLRLLSLLPRLLRRCSLIWRQAVSQISISWLSCLLKRHKRLSQLSRQESWPSMVACQTAAFMVAHSSLAT